MAKRQSNVDKLDIIVDKISGLGTRLEVHIANFESHVANEVERKEALAQNTKVLQENTSSLQDHMKRTDALESYVKKIDERFTPVELESLRKRAVNDWWKSKVWLGAKLGGALGAVGALVGIARWLIHSI